MKSYDEHWTNWPTSGPANWRRHYHGQPNPDFVALCDEAEARGMTVSLNIGSTLKGRDGEKYRDLTAITVDQGTRLVAAAHLGMRTLSQAARHALEVMARA